METNFSDIQQLWQSQKAKEFDVAALTSRMKQIEQKQKREWIIGISLTPITIIFLAFVIPWQDSILGAMSLIIIAFGMAWVIWLNSKSRLNPVDDSERFDSQEFIQSQLKKLNLRYTILKKHMIIYGFILIVAINLTYLIVLEPLSLSIQITAHIGATLMIAGIMWFTIHRKKKKYDEELSPLIEELKAMLDKKQSEF